LIATPTEITHFIEIFQTKHISKAAIRLGITQPTLTQSLQKLEEKLGTVLFFRTKQGVVPTEEGNLFYASAGRLFDNWRDIKTLVSNSRGGIQGNFRVGCHQSVGTYMLPQFFENLSHLAPEIQIELVHDFSRKITEQVISYEIEMGFVINPVKHLDLVLKKLGEDKVEFWKKKNLIEVPKKIFAETNLKQIESLLGKTFYKEFKGWSLVQTPSLEVVRELVVQGRGVGILPGRVAKLAQKDITTYKKTLPVFHDELFLAYRKEVLSSVAGRILIQATSNVTG